MATSPRQIRCACNGRKLPDVLDRPGVIDGFDKTGLVESSVKRPRQDPLRQSNLCQVLCRRLPQKRTLNAWGYKRRETTARVKARSKIRPSDWVSKGTITSYEDEEKQEGSHSTTTTAASIACQPNEPQPGSRACFTETSVTNDQMRKVGDRRGGGT
ncbi:hypothetical protein BKA70DRAFT_1317623 [Coprinopsis sp. MPI-PUGE-AT-0042]|nr:hypothetical protein BKA70DRAFT_1317623 [Coprinopsis sp. MPI-PUGE-AT-0042]